MRGAYWWAAAALLTLLLLAPLAVTDFPPLLDYPNHLARLFVLASAADDPVLSRMFAAPVGDHPNLAIDLIGPPMIRILPVGLVGRLLLGLALLLPVIGTVAHHRLTFGGRALFPLACVLIATNALFLMGFMNFLISIGVALILAGLWNRFAPARPALAAVLLGGLTIPLFFCHLFGVIYLGVLIGADIVDRLLAGAKPRIAVYAASAFIPSALLFWLSPSVDKGAGVVWAPVPGKLLESFSLFLNYHAGFDIPCALVCIAVLVMAVARRWLLVPRRTTIALTVLLASFAAAPFGYGGGAMIDIRFLVMAGFCFFAGATASAVPKRVALALAASAILLFVVRTVLVAEAWHSSIADITAFRGVIEPIEPGARVLVVTAASGPADWARAPAWRSISGFIPLDANLPALVTLEHRAFWPGIFASPSQQPLRILPPYEALGRAAPAPSLDQLATLAFGSFDYVLVMDAGSAPVGQALLPDRLEPLARADIAALFRLRR